MKTAGIESRLQSKGVKPTANRITVMRALMSASGPVSLAELEEILETLDKSSIFRVLTLFVRNHVVHAMEDGSGSMKYELCSGESECTLDDMHAHFYCEVCHRTYCLPEVHVSVVALPDGFEMDSINYMIKGRCAKCRK